MVAIHRSAMTSPARKLVVNPVEAESVRLIFQRYLDLGCVDCYAADLIERGVMSKRRASRTGEQRGGKPIGRNALYLILSNRTYIGETTHKGASYLGETRSHCPAGTLRCRPGRLAELGPALSGNTRMVQDAPYAGLLIDETGAAMLPTYPSRMAASAIATTSASPH